MGQTAGGDVAVDSLAIGIKHKLDSDLAAYLDGVSTLHFGGESRLGPKRIDREQRQ